ncbi:ABC transporter permease [Xylophilus sp.]|uniref:ABC transporter permease n=1 Tax=Xylophilus sp. TaxID=2653893 RepID=UPI0013BA5CA5|nr:ABC transporter permease [Xylophilus sp.]KAF1044543.1 MAG: Dipeptide transport system permease protein DppB [Xylophilus sp.]
MGWFGFLGARAARGVLVVLLVVVVNFFLIRLAPGDPAQVMAGEMQSDDPALVERLRAEFGLDRSTTQQLRLYLGAVLRGDLGHSYRNHVDVCTLIAERVPATLLLMVSAFVFALVPGVGLGVLAVRARLHRRWRWADGAIFGAAMLLYATPTFWLSLMLVIVFSVQLDWLPAFGMQSGAAAAAGGLAQALDVARHLVLPTVALGTLYMAVYVQLTRAAMLEVLHQDFVRSAQAKGVPPTRILRVHVLRNALLPVLSMAGIQLGQLAGGAILIETVFAWPGIGRLMFDAVSQRDYPLLLGIFLTTAVMVVVFNLVTDVLYRIADPRIARA